MGGLAGPVGFDAPDRLIGGPPDGPGVFAEVDGDAPVEVVTHNIRKALLALRHHPESSD